MHPISHAQLLPGCPEWHLKALLHWAWIQGEHVLYDLRPQATRCRMHKLTWHNSWQGPGQRVVIQRQRHEAARCIQGLEQRAADVVVRCLEDLDLGISCAVAGDASDQFRLACLMLFLDGPGPQSRDWQLVKASCNDISALLAGILHSKKAEGTADSGCDRLVRLLDSCNSATILGSREAPTKAAKPPDSLFRLT